MKPSREKFKKTQPAAMDGVEKEHCPVVEKMTENLKRVGLGALLSQAPLGSLTCFSFL